MRTAFLWIGLVLLGVGSATTTGFSKKASRENRPMTVVEYVGIPPFFMGVVLTFWSLRVKKPHAKQDKAFSPVKFCREANGRH
jgi:hypothetical protein